MSRTTCIACTFSGLFFLTCNAILLSVLIPIIVNKEDQIDYINSAKWNATIVQVGFPNDIICKKSCLCIGTMSYNASYTIYRTYSLDCTKVIKQNQTDIHISAFYNVNNPTELVESVDDTLRKLNSDLQQDIGVLIGCIAFIFSLAAIVFITLYGCIKRREEIKLQPMSA